MFKDLIEQLIRTGLTESDVGKAIGRSQATVNRVRNGKQELTGWDAVEKLRALHRERCNQGSEADTHAEVARILALDARAEREAQLLQLDPHAFRMAVESELVLQLASRMREGIEPTESVPAWLQDRVLEMANIRPAAVANG